LPIQFFGFTCLNLAVKITCQITCLATKLPAKLPASDRQSKLADMCENFAQKAPKNGYKLG
jgi:hypothetical protein